LALLIVSLAAAGLIQGAALNDAAVSFAAIAERTRPWLLAATVAEGLILLGNLLLAANFARTVGCPSEVLKEAFAS
jgi:cbb3-type cytochrome oxidase subunit 1